MSTEFHKRSKLRVFDTIGESWLELSRHPGRAIMTGIGVTLGAAAIVATMTLVSTIRFQVSDQFDARRATQVELRLEDDQSDRESPTDFPPAATVMQRAISQTGLLGLAALRESREEVEVVTSLVLDPTSVPTRFRVYGLNSNGFEALDARVEGPGWDDWHDQTHQRVVVVGEAAASRMGASDLVTGDLLYVGGLAFSVVGILEDSPRIPPLVGGIVMPATTASLFELDQQRDRIVAITAPGAAQDVAEALPFALTPESPDIWTSYSPRDDTTLRQEVDSQLEALALGLGAIVLILGIVTIGNATLSSVMQRINEIGLRRALGARPRHIGAHILLDAAGLGLIGGLVGALLGLTTTLAVTAYRGWVPVIDYRVLAYTILGGLIAGGLAGTYPAVVGSRLQPTEALRRE